MQQAGGVCAWRLNSVTLVVSCISCLLSPVVRTRRQGYVEDCTHMYWYYVEYSERMLGIECRRRGKRAALAMAIAKQCYGGLGVCNGVFAERWPSFETTRVFRWLHLPCLALHIRSSMSCHVVSFYFWLHCFRTNARVHEAVRPPARITRLPLFDATHAIYVGLLLTSYSFLTLQGYRASSPGSNNKTSSSTACPETLPRVQVQSSLSHLLTTHFLFSLSSTPCILPASPFPFHEAPITSKFFVALPRLRRHSHHAGGRLQPYSYI